MPQRREGEAAEATAVPAGRNTLESVSGAERIADALALVAAEAERVQVCPYMPQRLWSSCLIMHGKCANALANKFIITHSAPTNLAVCVNLALGCRMACLDPVYVCMCYEQAFEEDPAASKGGRPLAPNPLLLGLPPEAYMLKQLGSVRAGDLEQALLILPFSDALRLLQYFCAWLERGTEVGACTGPLHHHLSRRRCFPLYYSSRLDRPSSCLFHDMHDM